MYVRKIVAIFAMAGVLTIPVMYNSCAPQHSPGSSSFAASLCDGLVAEAFSNYHNVLKANCGSCHISGGVGNGAFADSDMSVALDAFKGKGESKIYSFATVEPPHKPGLGAGMTGPFDSVRGPYQAAEADYLTCLSNAGEAVPDLSDQPNQFTTTKSLAGVTNNFSTLTWDLGSEMRATGFPGAQFTIEIQTATRVAAGQTYTSYEFRNPRIRAGAQALHAKSVWIEWNGSVYTTGTTFRSAERSAPANLQRDMSPNGGTLIWDGPISASHNIAIGFNTVETVTFDPPTYTSIYNGLFTDNTIPGGQTCVSCHGGSGGLTIGTNRNGLINSGNVVPFYPEASLVYTRLTNAGNPMPPAGVITDQATLDGIRDWILDGAL